MTQHFQCFGCGRITQLNNEMDEKCSNCGGTKGRIITEEELNKMTDRGTAWIIDPSTGKRMK